MQQPSLLNPDKVIDCPRLLDIMGAYPETDIFLIGDGSGTTLHGSCGWAVWVAEPPFKRARLLTGSLSNGTNNTAELFPYLQALHFLNCENPRPRKVVVVSDSELTVRCGNRIYGRQANAPLWAMLDWFETQGWTIRFHHVRRNTNELSRLADHHAGMARIAMDELVKSLQASYDR